MAAPSDDAWWRSAVVYQIYPRSFCDTDGDGVGDLEGVRRHLDHLAWLGVDAIWLSPFFPSPMADFGYDVADYCDVDPLFGSLHSFDVLLAECHSLGLKVLIDWVANHTSSQHPWFVEARSSRESEKRDWYVWHEGTPDKPPNNWRAAFPKGPAWTWDTATEEWYLHLFMPEQPDLNWANPAVEAAMHETLRFWLDRGVDGFRMDVVHLIGKDHYDDLPDHLVDLVVAVHDHPGTHPLLRRIRGVLDEYPGERISIGEVVLMKPALVAPYYGAHDELHMAFNFQALWADWDAVAMRQVVERAVAAFDPVDAWPTWVLSNHDNRRHRTRYGSEARARAAAVLLLTLRGTPFLYAGEELGLEDAPIPPERQIDPGGRDGCRAPVPWEPRPPHGWSRERNWLPFPPEAGERSASRLRLDADSILHLYRRVLEARRGSPALHAGAWKGLDAPSDVLAYERVAGDDRRLVLVNFSAKPASVPVEGEWLIEVATNLDAEGAAYDGRLAGDAALILRPA